MEKFNLSQIISQSFLGMVQKCLREKIPWQTPFINTGTPISAATDQHYRGINVFQLLISAWINKWADPRWGTYKTWQLNGAQVKRGSRGTMAVYYKQVPWETTNEKTGETIESTRPLMRYYKLFNAEQCNNVPTMFLPETGSALHIEIAEKYLSSAGADIKYSNHPPYYDWKNDQINLLHSHMYKDTQHATATESYYSAWTHELTHWTGAKNRNNRTMEGDKNSDEYAYEELIAEFGAILLCNKLNITLEPKLANATYLASWITRLKKDNNALIRATSQAQKAIDYIEEVTDVDIKKELT
tara:strand:+ start:624 stop:1523 length:900 start_codon:yes stop_codon:yes gene_type:complete